MGSYIEKFRAKDKARLKRIEKYKGAVPSPLIEERPHCDEPGPSGYRCTRSRFHVQHDLPLHVSDAGGGPCDIWRD